jgi:hypothetical protein
MQSFLSFTIAALTGLVQVALTGSSGSPPPALNGSLSHDWFISIGPRDPSIIGYNLTYAGVLAIIDQRDANKASYEAGEA